MTKIMVVDFFKNLFQPKPLHILWCYNSLHNSLKVLILRPILKALSWIVPSPPSQ